MDKEHQMLNAKILKNQGFKQKEIAEVLEVTDRTVRNYLNTPARQRKKAARLSKLDPFRPFISSIIDIDPYYNCILLYDRLTAQGYTGKISILRDYVAELREKIFIEAVIRFETEPGRQAQVDWKEYRRITPDGKKETVYAFVMLLGYSRKPFVKFTKSMKQSVLLACHTEAFNYFGGVSHEILYDNMKTAFVCDPEGNWKPNKRLLSFANHYGYTPRRCRVRRPQTKGKVERAIGYMNVNFWPQVKDDVWDLDVLNESVQRWCDQICHNILRDFQETRAQRFEFEKPYLKNLPESSCDYRDIYEPIVNRESYITFETNMYSVPPVHIGQQLTLKVNPVNQTAELFLGSTTIREFNLEKPGSRKKIMTLEDKEAIRILWLKQQEKRLKKYKKKKLKGQPPIEVRSPASYERLLENVEVA
jgi:transposase